MAQSKERHQGQSGNGAETRPRVITVDLQGKVPGGASIKFLRAEMPNERHFPFAAVFYTLEGAEDEKGLRLDLHKRCFLDHFDDDSPEEAVCRRAAPELASLIASARPGLAE